MRQNGFVRPVAPIFAAALILAALGPAPRPARAEESAGTCLIIRGTLLMRNQPCVRTVTTRINNEGRQVIDLSHAWPAGAPTIVTAESETVLIDGEEAIPAGGTLGLSCFMNRRNEVFFCFFETP